MKNLKQIRESRGMSQKFVALSIGVSAPQISKWEAEVTEPALENLVKLAELYGITTDRLLGLPDRAAGLTGQEAQVLDAFRHASPEIKNAVCAVLGLRLAEKEAMLG